MYATFHLREADRFFLGGLECKPNYLGGLLRGALRRVDRNLGKTTVEHLPVSEAALGQGRILEIRPMQRASDDRLQHASVKQCGKGCAQKDDPGPWRLFEQETVGQGLRCAATKGDHHTTQPQGTNQDKRFQPTKGGLSPGREQSGDGASRMILDQGIEIEKAPAERRSKHAAHGRLACSHKAG